MTGSLNLHILEQTTLRNRLPQLALTALALMGSSACSGENDTYVLTPAAPEGAGGTDSSSKTDSQGVNSTDTEPVYVIYTTVDDPDSRTSYFITTSSLADNVFVDATQGLELSGGRSFSAPREGGFFVVSGDDAPTLTRYALDDDGKLAEGGTVSFANYGASPDVVMWVSPSRAYVYDGNNFQILGFNPTTMALLDMDPVSLDGFRCDDEDAFTSRSVFVERDDGFYFSQSCYAPDGLFVAGTALVHFDPETEEATVTKDSRCTAMEFGFLADNGDAYWYSVSDASVRHSFQELDISHDCALRVRAGEATFDPDWELDLTTRAGGASVIGAAPAGGSKIWVKVFEKESMTDSIPVEEIDWGLLVWRWGLLDMETNEDVVLDTQAELAVYYGTALSIDERTYIPSSNADYTETTLLDLSSTSIRRGLLVPGELRNAVRLR